jgi:prevent-host-death family protein
VEISAKQARRDLSTLLKQVEKGDEVVVLRRGKQVARIVPLRGQERYLPSLSEFRASIKIKGKTLSKVVSHAREEVRY